MIKLGKLKEIGKVRNLPVEIQDKVQEVLVILDNEYGSERNVNNDLGGFVAIVNTEEALGKLGQENHLSFNKHEAEWIINIVTRAGEVWKQALFVISNDYSIVIIGREDILKI